MLEIILASLEPAFKTKYSTPTMPLSGQFLVGFAVLFEIIVNKYLDHD